MSEMRGEQKAKEREQQKEKEEDYGDSAIGEQCPVQVAEASLVCSKSNLGIKCNASFR